MEVTKFAALDSQAAQGDRLRGAFPGKHHDGIAGPRQERGEQTADPTGAEHRHAKPLSRHQVDLSFEQKLPGRGGGRASDSWD